MTIAGKILRGIAGVGLGIFGVASANPAVIAAGAGVVGSAFGNDPVTADYQQAAANGQAQAAKYSSQATRYVNAVNGELQGNTVQLSKPVIYIIGGLIGLVVLKILGVFGRH